jgi:hypothetical protein
MYFLSAFEGTKLIACKNMREALIKFVDECGHPLPSGYRRGDEPDRAAYACLHYSYSCLTEASRQRALFNKILYKELLGEEP